MKRVFALIFLIIILALIIATVAAAILQAPPNLLFALIFCDIAIPVSIYAFLMITKYIKKN